MPRSREPICILGLGFVGLTLAVAFAERGYPVVGVDISPERLAKLRAGKAPFVEPKLEEKMRSSFGKTIEYVDTIPDLAQPVTYIITVGTDLLQSGAPDYRALKEASRMIGKRLKKRDLVIIRSTTTIGSTRTIVRPLLERGSSLTAGKNFHLAFAPERTIEGKALEEIVSLPQLIGGYTPACTDRACAVFSALTPTLVPLNTLEEAELAKLMTNSYRDIAFAFSNNLARIAAEHSIDVNAAIAAANYQYPRNSIPLPSPGVGGYCLTKDSYLLTAHSKKAAGFAPFHRAARSINKEMPRHVAEMIASFVKQKKIKAPRILIVGLAFKGHPVTSDVRHSPSKEVIDALRALRLKRIAGYDAHVADAVFDDWQIGKVPTMKTGLTEHDIVVFMHKNDAHRTPLPKKRRASLVVDPWKVHDQQAVAKAGWHYSTLSVLPTR